MIVFDVILAVIDVVIVAAVVVGVAFVYAVIDVVVAAAVVVVVFSLRLVFIFRRRWN